MNKCYCGHDIEEHADIDIVELQPCLLSCDCDRYEEELEK